MDIVNIVFGIVTVVSFLLALYQKYEIKQHALTEESKFAVQSG